MPVRVGLIGYGFAARTFHAPLIDALAEVTLAAIATSRADAVAAERPGARLSADGRDLLDDASLDLIVIATPNDSHAHWVRAALEAGKHVVVEKPFALDLAEARALTQLAEERGLLLAVFHNRRWDSDYLTVKRAIEANRVGRIVHFESHMDRFRPVVRRRWREGGGPGAGIWYDLAPHLVDQALLLFGLPSRVTAMLAGLRDGALGDDWAHAILTYPDKRVIIHASMLAAGGSPRFLAHGTAGSFVKQGPDPQERQLLSGIRPGAATPTPWCTGRVTARSNANPPARATSVNSIARSRPPCVTAHRTRRNPMKSWASWPSSTRRCARRRRAPAFPWRCRPHPSPDDALRWHRLRGRCFLIPAVEIVIVLMGHHPHGSNL